MLKKLWNNGKGQSMVEYTLILSLVVVGLIAVTPPLVEGLSRQLDKDLKPATRQINTMHRQEKNTPDTPDGIWDLLDIYAENTSGGNLLNTVLSFTKSLKTH